MSRKLEEKNPRLFGQWQKALADSRNLNQPNVCMEDSVKAIIFAVVGFILTGIFADNNPYIAIILSSVATFISAGACDMRLVNILSKPLAIFALLLEWGADGGQNKGIGSMIMAMLLVYIVVKSIVAVVRWKAYESNEKANQAIFEEVRAFARREHQELVQKYQPVLGEEFIKKCCPVAYL